MCESPYGIKKLELGQNIHQLSSSLKFCNSVFLCQTRDFVIVEDIIYSVGSGSGQHPKCSIIVSLGSADLN
jgi:hypothetical protein